MKNLSLITGTLISLLGLYFFLNPERVMASAAWIFALVMLVSGIAGLMFHFNNPNRQLLQLVQSVISIVFALILLTASPWKLSGIAVTLLAWWLLISAITQGLSAYRLRQFGFSGQPALTIAILCLVFALFFFSQPLFSTILIGRLVAALILFAGISLLSLAFRL